MVSALLVGNSMSKFPTKRRFETSLHNEYRDPKSQRPNVDAIDQYPSGHNTVATFRTTLRKNEDDLGAKISDSVAQTNVVGSLRYKFHPEQSSTGVSRPTKEWDARSGCDCFDGCSEKCPCALKNGGEFAFNNNGTLIKTKPLVYECVYECGSSCKCSSSSCSNRVSQHGIRIQLEVFQTKSKGWGVRSRNYIPSGSFICEYIGELLHDKEAEARIDKDEYLFDIGDRDDNDDDDDDNSILLDSESSSSTNVVDGGGFTIDAAQYGNVARFINHSCARNLHAQDVLYDHDDRRAPHIMFF